MVPGRLQGNPGGVQGVQGTAWKIGRHQVDFISDQRQVDFISDQRQVDF